MKRGTRKCSSCEEYIGPESVAVDEPCAMPAGEHLKLTGSTGSGCRVVLCAECYAEDKEMGLNDRPLRKHPIYEMTAKVSGATTNE